MTKPHKIAFLSPDWGDVTYQAIAGALRYADAHPPTLFHRFVPAKDIKATIAEMEKWGAEGMIIDLDDEVLKEFLSLLHNLVPIVNLGFTQDYPGVFRVYFTFQDFVDTALEHLRDLGVRSSAMFTPEEGQHMSGMANAYLQITRPRLPSRSTLTYVVDPETRGDPHAPVQPVPAKLADWLHSLPKPTGILCPTVGGGSYIIRCCQALGLRVPEDIAVIGADFSDLCLSCEPTLTSIVPAIEMAGYEAMRVLLDWIGGTQPTKSSLRLQHMDLHVRESTGQRKPEICDVPGALQYIQDNACKGLTVAQLIKETQRVSRATFHQRFQDVTGKTPAEAIRDRKLDEVRRLLSSTKLPMEMVAYLSGFSSAMVLARNFRAIEGITLSEYRKKNKIPTI